MSILVWTRIHIHHICVNRKPSMPNPPNHQQTQAHTHTHKHHCKLCMLTDFYPVIIFCLYFASPLCSAFIHGNIGRLLWSGRSIYSDFLPRLSFQPLRHFFVNRIFTVCYSSSSCALRRHSLLPIHPAFLYSLIRHYFYVAPKTRGILFERIRVRVRCMKLNKDILLLKPTTHL